MERIKSFGYALDGIVVALKEEPNLKFHFIAAALVFVLGFLLDVNHFDWLILLLTITIVITIELLNTAIENLCDHVTPEQHPMIKKVKDISAGAVLIVAIAAVVIAVVIFGPYIMHLLDQ